MSKISILSLFICTVCFIGKTTGLAQNNSTNTTITLTQPPYLKVGDTVAIVAPSGILKNRTDEIEEAKKLLISWGLHPVLGEHVFNQNNHFAGTDAERCEDVQNAMDNPSIKAIWCARGGYGAVRIIDKLDFTAFNKKPKWLIGFSDITALHNLFHIKGFETIHALMCTSLPDDLTTIPETIETFRKAIFGESLNYTLKGSNYNREGSVTAPVVGGNLSLLYSMLGSKTSIDTTGKILFIEEIGEYKYHIDRMLQGLKRAGYFDHCAGVLIGDMSRVKRNTTPWGTSVEQLIIDVLKDYNFPIAFNMPAGHEKDNRALILGKTVEFVVKTGQSTIIFKNM
ncbi:S66 peptidase family protein [Aestuariibaculum sediminum]|uniref:LD-carboxypeptidase n=1 Tax=Aestuariibaculum sediminum TaxID=2770637 RepID=A0A8J6Q745_9FLAO|nr:LD-carboxypeptidase [Aestuariibaculum sediminum]MBD0831395.1 LD-carboxypeptidase [Aestuariibaculum sediminum]